MIILSIRTLKPPSQVYAEKEVTIEKKLILTEPQEKQQPKEQQKGESEVDSKVISLLFSPSASQLSIFIRFKVILRRAKLKGMEILRASLLLLRLRQKVNIL